MAQHVPLFTLVAFTGLWQQAPRGTHNRTLTSQQIASRVKRQRLAGSVNIGTSEHFVQASEPGCLPGFLSGCLPGFLPECLPGYPIGVLARCDSLSSTSVALAISHCRTLRATLRGLTAARHMVLLNHPFLYAEPRPACRHPCQHMHSSVLACTGPQLHSHVPKLRTSSNLRTSATPLTSSKKRIWQACTFATPVCHNGGSMLLQYACSTCLLTCTCSHVRPEDE